MLLLAQAGIIPTVAYWAIIVVIVIAIVAAVVIFTNKAGIPIPPWVVQLFWILVIAVVVIAAIKFLVRLA
jgi:L-asparagine transporter-like permease